MDGTPPAGSRGVLRRPFCLDSCIYFYSFMYLPMPAPHEACRYDEALLKHMVRVYSGTFTYLQATSRKPDSVYRTTSAFTNIFVGAISTKMIAKIYFNFLRRWSQKCIFYIWVNSL